MQIKIEIDVKPEELRRFLGLPDVAGLQEDLIQFVREKVGAASDSFDPANFVKENFQSLKESTAWRKLMSAAKATTSNVAGVVKPAPPPVEPVRAGKTRAARKKGTAGKRAAAKPSDD